ncbi:MAG: formamidopyrimidine-DNA glycosylase [Phycisphaerae bacterium]|nr:formamidopyrimidine-DNA glycosylase [Phycisphaerae bacterium]
MPELPDLTIYVEALSRRVIGRTIVRHAILGPFVLRTAEPSIDEIDGRAVSGIRRLGKQIVWELDDGRRLLFHLMIAGRFRWIDAGGKSGRGRAAGTSRERRSKIDLAWFEFDGGRLVLTEAGTKKRASLHLLASESALRPFDRGGIEPLTCDAAAFRAALLRENHTLKRALTDPRLVAGIGNAYSDEILHAARLSPVLLTQRTSPGQIECLHAATKAVLGRWIERLRTEFGDRFPGPGEITAFRDGFAVHGRFEKPCPDCGTPVERIRYAENETNYCPRCQTDGRLLADRSLSRLLREDRPRSLPEASAKARRTSES